MLQAWTRMTCCCLFVRMQHNPSDRFAIRIRSILSTYTSILAWRNRAPPPHATDVYSQTYSRKCVLLLFPQWLRQFFGNITAYCLKLPLIIINEFKYTIYTFAWYTTFVHKLRCVSKRKQSKLVSLQYNPMKWRGLLMSPMFGDPISM